jgi:Superinfection immunity protein
MHLLALAAAVTALGDLAVAAAALYLLPVLVGQARRISGIGPVATINVLLGWTLIGWVAALALALRSPQLPGPARWQRPPAGPALALAHGGWQARDTDLHPRRQGVPPPLDLPPRPAGRSATS